MIRQVILSETTQKYNGSKIGQGRETAKEYIHSNEDVKEEILKAIKEARQ